MRTLQPRQVWDRIIFDVTPDPRTPGHYIIEGQLRLSCRRTATREACDTILDRIRTDIANEMMASIYEDRQEHVNVWLDVLCRNLRPLDWEEVALAREALLNIARYCPPQPDGSPAP